ncbi:hypothetical protein CALCODRAFT_310610 [Calocera cornea HHB12733]|uniref:PWWP domain-containing protein n=1 Tax=Calocera cornea HHB12733 TaxID=1353952 RepID=A0A165FEU5_9BASI|nr:hypothetical protein CALCODRAFT_310610 [Calocera cornea HHB12733]
MQMQRLTVNLLSGWFTDSHVWRTDAAQLKRLEIVSTDSVAKEAFRIAQDPAKWRTTFNASLKVMVEARRATDIEHDDKAKAKDDSMAPDDKDATVADGDEEGSNIDDHDNYEDLQPSRHLRSHAHLLGPDRYEVGELVLGKLQGHPPWPGKIADPHKLPMQIALACPDRDDPDVYPIRFYPDGDYWWVKHTEIIRLDQERVAKFVRETRANFGPLLEGYKIARDTSEWEANNPTPEDVVDLYMIEMPEKPKPKVVEQKMSHKRKRGHHRDDSGTPQPNKRRKRGEDGEEHKPRKRKMQSMSQDYVNGDVKNESMESSVVDQRPPLSPRAAAAEQAQERKNKLLKMRWLLQKTFLSGEKPNDMKFPDASRVIDELQKDTEITGAVLRETKLQKVLMGITKMDFIRNDDEFDFRGRARALLKQWEHIPMPPSSNAGDGLGERGGSAKPSLSGLDLGLSPLVINTQLPKAGSVLGSAASQRASVPRGMSTPSALLTALPSAADDTPTQDHA